MSIEQPSGPGDDSTRKRAIKKIAKRGGVWAIPVAGIAVLCLLLGVPWWLVLGGIALFVGIIVFDA